MQNKDLEKLRSIDRRIHHLDSATAVLGWDHQTYMPDRSVDERSEQLALLESMSHQMSTSSEIKELLDALGADDSHPDGQGGLNDLDKAFIREVYRNYRNKVKLPERLVADLARETSLAQPAWADARKNEDFDAFAPYLEKCLDLIREKAERLGYEDHIYDALLDEYEPSMKTAEVTAVFSQLAGQLAPLVSSIKDAGQVRTDFLTREFPAEAQERFGRKVLEEIGFDFERGRLDVSTHPFTTSLGPHDVRLTTRYDTTYFATSLFGSIHEAGHGMYEQGFGEEISGTVLGEAVSLGIHESQSRSWENIIGRSRGFWNRFYPELVEIFPSQLSDVSLEEFYRGINRVEPSFIRVEADEVTYSLHIILRFELEKNLVSGDLKVKDLPEAWNTRMRELLGIVPAYDSEGVLQDIHWSAGLMGYFPTYALGNLYGAQFAASIRKELPHVDSLIESGDFAPILAWQRNDIHKHGRIFSAGDLCKNATGEYLNPAFFMDQLREKYSDIYDL